MPARQKYFLLAFGGFPMFLALVAAWSCAASNMEGVEAAAHSEEGSSTISPSEARNPKNVDDLIEVIEGLSSWRFDRNHLDKTHPRYNQIIEQQFAALESYLEQGLSLVDADITFQIKNEPTVGHGGMAAQHTVNDDGSTTITYYSKE